MLFYYAQLYVLRKASKHNWCITKTPSKLESNRNILAYTKQLCSMKIKIVIA